MKNKKGLIRNRHAGCPLTHNNSQWCFQLCHPDKDSKGHCGRFAPHAIRGRTQIAIDEYKKNN